MNVDKNFKFTCQKAVTTPLNAISDVSAEHLKDKLIKLTALTSGQMVQATENTRFQVTQPFFLILLLHGNYLLKNAPPHSASDLI